MKKIKTLAAAAVVAVSLFSMQGDAMAAEDNTISVRGIAKQEVAPDMAYLTLGISVKGDTAESVRTQAAEASQKVRRALLGMAISENNIQSSSYNLYPDYENVNGKNKQKGYALNTTLRIKVDDLKKLGDIIDKTVQEGVTNVNQVSFALSEESNVQRQLLAAVDNARAKAAIVANAGGRNLGEMLSADISDYNGETMVAAGTNYKRSLAADVAAPTQLMPGTLKIDASVEVTFKLN
jgi:uncharacterized protein YggE